MKIDPQMPQLCLIRHAPTVAVGRLCGRTDVDAVISADAATALRRALTGITGPISSPAKRCQQTCAALFDGPPELDPRLWEQDFGDHDGLPYSDLPDLGVLDGAELTDYRPPNGESFGDLTARIAPALHDHARRARDQGRAIALIVHAGVIRAALAHLLGDIPAGLRFEVPNLGLTRLRVGPEGLLSVISVNEHPA